MSVNEFGLEELFCLPCLISCIISKPPTFWHITVSEAINGDIPNYIFEFRWRINCWDRRYMKQQLRSCFSVDISCCWWGWGEDMTKPRSLTVLKHDAFLSVISRQFMSLFTFHLLILVFAAPRKYCLQSIDWSASKDKAR